MAILSLSFLAVKERISARRIWCLRRVHLRVVLNFSTAIRAGMVRFVLHLVAQPNRVAARDISELKNSKPLVSDVRDGPHRKLQSAIDLLVFHQ